MMSKMGVFIIAISLIWELQLSCMSQPENGSSRPNFVFILADDMTYNAIGALGNSQIRTPNLDRLVASGTTFSHAYNMGGWNGAICIASRAMIISGRSLWEAQAISEKWKQSDSTALDQTWGRWMEKAGYNTYMTGKWHVNAPANEVFQYVRNERPGMPGDAWTRGMGGKNVTDAIAAGGDVAAAMPIGYNRPLAPDNDNWDPADTLLGGFWEGGHHWSEVLKEDALTFLNDAAQRTAPFFMYLAFNAPHDPRQSPQQYLDLYPVGDIEVPASFLPEYPDAEAIGLGPGLRDEALAPFPRSEYAVQKHIQEYYALISHLDSQIGEILDALESSGKMEDTYVIFTADHGLAVGQHGLMGKQNMYDHSLRVPFVVAGPDVPKGEVRRQSIYLQDGMATILDWAGVSKPEGVYFESFRDILNDAGAKSHHRAIYGAYMNLQRMIKRDDFKLILYPGIHKLLLYCSSREDPYEVKDLSREEQYKPLINSLLEELHDLQTDLGDDLDISGFMSME